MNINYAELLEALTPEDIKAILARFDIKPVVEAINYIIFPTACHNLTGGSPKLYYYKNSHLFKCYTQCGDVFNIFTLLIRICALRGTRLTYHQAAELCWKPGLSFLETGQTKTVTDDIAYLYDLLHAKSINVKLPVLNDSVLGRFVFDQTALQLWANEGISFATMHKYHISYDPVENCIIIPNYDIDGNLISIRGRYLDEDATAKYKPIIYGGKVLSHPSSMALYGLHLTKQAITQQHRAIIFEAEKSVLMMDTCYGDNNIAVATLGKTISMPQIRMLLGLGVTEVMLAYDADYTDYHTMDAKRDEYTRIANTLKTYFNVSILLDLDFNKLQYKDSPIDRGQDIFEELLKTRIYI